MRPRVREQGEEAGLVVRPWRGELGEVWCSAGVCGGGSKVVPAWAACGKPFPLCSWLFWVIGGLWMLILV